MANVTEKKEFAYGGVCINRIRWVAGSGAAWPGLRVVNPTGHGRLICVLFTFRALGLSQLMPFAVNDPSLVTREINTDMNVLGVNFDDDAFFLFLIIAECKTDLVSNLHKSTPGF